MLLGYVVETGTKGFSASKFIVIHTAVFKKIPADQLVQFVGRLMAVWLLTGLVSH